MIAGDWLIVLVTADNFLRSYLLVINSQTTEYDRNFELWKAFRNSHPMRFFKCMNTHEASEKSSPG